MARWRQNLNRRRAHYASRAKSKNLVKSRKFAKWAKLAFIGVIALFIITFIIVPIFAVTLPSPDKVVRREGFSTKILDRNGEVLYDIFEDERRTPVAFEEIPLHLRQATVSIEDKNFYEHKGFDIFGYARAVFNIAFRGRLQGGSTLTQQLVKNALLTSDRTILRKVKEFVLTTQIERKFSKDEILQMYLNEVPYGGTAFGVQTASETYFGKSVQGLDLVESAVLAGLPQRPSVYSPYSSTPDAYIARTESVLRRMREDGHITEEEEEEAKENLKDIEFQERGAGFKAPHFVQYVEKVLEERYGTNVIESGGLRVTTTLDLELQEMAQDIVSSEIEKVEYLDITNGAAVVIDPETGEILAMVGSKDFSDPDYDGQVNVTMSLRQPGSAIKPVTYVTAFKKGYTASTMLMDVPTEYPGGVGQPTYKPENYDGIFRGPMQIRYALGNSINMIAVKTLALVGIKETLETAYDLGINSLEPTKQTLNRVGLSLTLGGGEVRLLELTGAYAAFLNKGYKVEPISILKVEDSKGKVLEEIKPKKGKRVLTEGQAFLIADILSDNGARSEIFGENSLLNIAGRTVAVKTGTTNDKRDNWAIGGDSQALVGVWVGNNDNTPMKKVASGISGASPIWRRIAIEALSGKPDKGFEIPGEIVSVQVDSMSGMRAANGFPERSEYFIKGTESGEDTIHVMLKVCKNDGRKATPGDIASGNYEEKEYFIIKEEDPTAGPGQENLWQKGILNWISGQGDGRYHPPTDFCGETNPVSAGFVEPGNESSNLSNKFKVRIRADSTSDIKEVTLFINGEKERGFSSPPYETEVELDKGTYELKAEVEDDNGRKANSTIKIGVKVDWDYVAPTPTPLASPTPTPSPEP